MSFRLGDIIIDRMQIGVAEDFDGNLLYTLTQLQEGTIDITGESKEARDANGTLVKKFWNAKSGTFTATNAMINTNIMAATSGSAAEIATAENPLDMPKIVTVKVGTTTTLKNFVEGTVKVNAFYSNGTMGDAYALGAKASETEFSLTEEGTFTPPTVPKGSDIVQFVVKYQRKVEAGVAIKNKADKFPGTVKLTIKVLAVDPCSADTLKAGYVVLPSFQVSPEVSIGLQTDATLEYKGDLQVQYCGTDKTLYEFYWADEDEEDE